MFLKTIRTVSPFFTVRVEGANEKFWPFTVNSFILTSGATVPVLAGGNCVSIGVVIVLVFCGVSVWVFATAGVADGAAVFDCGTSGEVMSTDGEDSVLIFSAAGAGIIFESLFDVRVHAPPAMTIIMTIIEIILLIIV